MTTAPASSRKSGTLLDGVRRSPAPKPRRSPPIPLIDRFDRASLSFEPDERTVRWLGWSDEAFALASSLDRPVLLSVVHDASHWCRLMDRESYAEPDVARLLNRSFVCVRVDAEDRPDLAAVYRPVARLVAGSGEYPLNVALTPDRRPFHAATYVPREGLFDLPGFTDVLRSWSNSWRHNRDELERRAAHLTSSLQVFHDGPSSHDSEVDTFEDAFATLWYQYEPERGGFGPSGKLPSVPALQFLLRYWKRTGNDQALEMVRHTLLQLRQGGVFDQIGFGFFHDCGDDEWMRPRFHKTAYDQALMALAYTEAYQATGDEPFADAAHELFTYLQCDLATDDGVFITSERAEDADADGTRHYLWTPDEVHAALGRELGDLFCRVFDIGPEGNYLDPDSGEPTGRSVPHLRDGIAAIAGQQGTHEATLRRQLQASCTELFIAREERVPPRRDGRVRTAYNGLAIAALSRAGGALDEPTYVDAARRAADWLLDHAVGPHGLRRRHDADDDDAHGGALLDDYVYLTWGLIELYQAGFAPRHLRVALELTEEMLERFWDDDRATLRMAPQGTADLPFQPLDLEDGELPSAVAVAVWNLARLSRLTARDELERRARTVIESTWSHVARAPTRYCQMLIANELLSAPSVQVVIAGDAATPEGEELLRNLRGGFHPAMQLLVRPDRPLHHPITELASYTEFQLSQAGIPTAYVCSGFCCESPTVDPDQMLADLERAGA